MIISMAGHAISAIYHAYRAHHQNGCTNCIDSAIGIATDPAVAALSNDIVAVGHLTHPSMVTDDVVRQLSVTIHPSPSLTTISRVEGFSGSSMEGQTSTSTISHVS